MGTCKQRKSGTVLRNKRSEMLSLKKYVPRFSSQQDSSQTSEGDPDQHTEACVRSRRKRKGGKPRAILKVKLPQFSSRTVLEKVTSGNKTPARWILEPTAAKTNSTGAPNGKTRCNNSTEVDKQDAVRDSEPANESSFFSSQGSNDKPTSEKEKAKLSVLRTISRMLEENQLIRQRLVALTQAN